MEHEKKILDKLECEQRQVDAAKRIISSMKAEQERLETELENLQCEISSMDDVIREHRIMIRELVKELKDSLISREIPI